MIVSRISDINKCFCHLLLNPKHEYEHWTLDKSRQKIELCPTKAASQRTQLSCVKLKNVFIGYRRLKTYDYSISIDLHCFGFFYEHFSRYFTDVFFPYSKMYNVFEHKHFITILCCFFLFWSTWESFSSENILYIIV